ncbi:unnamed protein product [Protopolystoma xenopodis]|uniref:Uncharacterized protein n=1 Tax=Protopolystoma xenopodis TaxID=117903 RepID=A0A448WM71_9PLAT|nr:unnamed protein product [Protopolystoma xenopodis]
MAESSSKPVPTPQGPLSTMPESHGRSTIIRYLLSSEHNRFLSRGLAIFAWPALLASLQEADIFEAARAYWMRAW